MRNMVLIVEDDEAVVHAIERTLRCADCDIVPAKSAEEGLAYLQDHDVDVVISDYGLGGMNGIDFLEVVSRKHPASVLILLTGSTNVKIAADAVNRFPLYKFFVKPWDNNEVLVAVKEAFKKRDTSKPREVTAADIMSKFPVTIKEDMSLSAAAELMMRFKISGMPVTSLSGQLTGIITVTDLFRVMGQREAKIASEGAPAAGDFGIAKVMSRNVETIKRKTTLNEMIGLMFEKNIHTLPVVEDDELVGIVGRRDVLNAYYRGSHISKGT